MSSVFVDVVSYGTDRNVKVETNMRAGEPGACLVGGQADRMVPCVV
jgi:hypothetical protein